MSPLAPIQVPDEPAAPRSASLLRFDPLLLLAAIGLAACSLITLHSATRTLKHGAPLYYVERQGIYMVIGVLLI